MLPYRLYYSWLACGSAEQRSSIATQLWFRPLAPTSEFPQQSSVLVSLVFSGCFSGLASYRHGCSAFPIDGSREQLLDGDKKCDLRCFHPTFHCSQVQREVERTSQNSFTQRCCPALWFQWFNHRPAPTEPRVYHFILPTEALISSLEPVMK